MRIISLETSTPRASVAFVDDETGFTAARRFEASGRLSRLLIPTLAELELETWPIAESGLIVTAGGPGSFTGLRVAMAAAKGLTFATGLPLVAVSSLAAIAAEAAVGEPIVSFLDARGGRYYYAVYDDSASPLAEIAPPRLGTGEELSYLPYDIFAGPPALHSEPPGRPRRRLEVWPDAATLARLGGEAFRRRGGDDVYTLRPVYLKRGQV